MLDKLEASGQVVKGKVTDGWARHVRRGSKRFTLPVHYSADGRAYGEEFGVEGSFFEAHAIGAEVDVKYLPSDPSQAILPGGSTDSVFTMWLGLAFVVLGIGGFIYTLVVGDIGW